jgi:hypothetical protein
MEIKKIKVDKKIKPLKVDNRRLVSFVIGSKYYVSFGNNEAKQCRLLEHDILQKRVNIELEYPKSYRTTMGQLTTSNHYLFEDEIGESPEHAVENEVTF